MEELGKALGMGLVGCLLVIGVVGLCLGVNLLLAWLAVVVMAGFGYAIPFWATFGAIILVQVFLGIIGRSVRCS